MAGIRPQTRLSCNPEIRISVGDSDIVASRPGRRDTCPSRTLLILDAFKQPRTLEEGLSHLASISGTALDWAKTTSQILELVRLEVLLTGDEAIESVAPTAFGFGGASQHISMLNDRRRTQTYIDAVNASVQPGDVVVDLGTGTGVLAATAVRAGARHVYAIERSAIAAAAKALFESVGGAERVTLLEGISTHVSLPEPADLMVSEIIGAEPLAERVLEYTHDAKQRFLKPDGRLLPQRLQIYGRLLELDPRFVTSHFFDAQNTARWADWYGLDYQVLQGIGPRAPFCYIADPEMLRAHKRLSEDFQLCDIDLTRLSTAVVDENIEIETCTAGNVNAVLVYFCLDIIEGHTLSSEPESLDSDSSWHCGLWIQSEPLPAEAGAPVQIRYRHGPVRTLLSCHSSL